MNITDLILKAIGNENATSAISSLLGLTQDQTKRATTAAVPSLLAGLTNLASTPQGADQLAAAVSRQDTTLADNLTGTLTGQGIKLADQGSDMLGSLLGSGVVSKLSSGLARFVGLGEGSTGKLLAMLTPVIFSFLGKQQKLSGLGASGLATLLAGQKDSIRAAMPAGLDTTLSSVLPGMGQWFDSARQAAPSPNVSRPRAEYEQPVRTETPRPSGTRWVLPLVLAAAALVGLLIWANRSRTNETVSTSGPARQTDAGFDMTPTSFQSQATNVIGNAMNVLAQVKDEASATEAVPKLKEVNTSLTGLRSVLNRIPESGRASAKAAIKPHVESLKTAAQAALAIPGVGNLIRPYVDDIIATLDSFTA